ncbi:MAG: hypothetical protein GY711_31300 [bacterium]|nr:hypothetical protein [bacterium]
MKRTLRSVTLLFLALAMAGVGHAQVRVKKRRILPPMPNQHIGGGGNDILMGTTGAGGDFVGDRAGPGDIDRLYDGPGSGDGEQDFMDSKDGDNLDEIWCGPEDSITADAGDKIFIVVKKKISWSGTYAQYLKRKGAMRWVRDRLQDRLADLEHPEDPWCDVVAFVSSELAAVPIPEPGEVVLFTDVFQIGPYAFCPLPDSPGDCLDWMPYAEDVDPVDATADLAFTSEELALVLADTQVLLDYASELACGTE